MFGGGGLDPRKMQQMMEQMGIETSDIDAEEVIIRTADEDLVFTSPEVQRISAQGQATYQIVGEPDTRDTSADADADADADEGGREEIPDDDVEIVVERTGVSTEQAREALEAEDGDLAAAVSRLE
ncbi:nascent polypeptide-associated complex protein [Halocatena pleomorpha]|uniref:Nascent polypeptide-associated complex protein n=1 Tax=Halocatena pleomorpha TaxID=1785090 RepID=A0A3P3RID3_9EURY|nr:nascent polypeptide-associated complex protein [Halocatena pleomorpha]RRJ33094.1 nascent polypeptide-associated complex protein [Halocatena pleomorpha]